ncbi:MAG: oligosaccharide flippase family protein [Bacteroidetes bacterium]|nr:oligosaccharide flippase family protein [Bacteroidota bacterium]
MLYIRTLLIMLVSLYTSRIILQTLGVSDFGIYNIVGGFIALFAFVNSAMTSATQRFLNYEMGKNNKAEVKRVFSMSLTTHILLSILLFIILESFGLWFFNSKINIPIDRMPAARWVYQFSVLSCCVSMLRVPYQASIISYEKMSFYAYISIVEVILKLGIVYSLLVINMDKLIAYSILVFIVTILINICYIIYCTKKFSSCHYKYFTDKKLFFKLISFSGWSMFGSMANAGANQGVSIIINIFFGVTMNAAFGIANQVRSAIYMFVSNFQTAFNPQIVKSYAANDKQNYESLVFRASRFSYFLLFIIALPVILCCQSILGIWLKEVPLHSANFVQLFLIFLLIDALSAPLWISVQATGKIKNYQLIISSEIALNLPIIYLCFKLGYPPESALVIRIIINFITHITRLFYLKKHIDFPAFRYIKEVMIKCFLVSFLIIPIPLFIHFHMADLRGDLITILSSIIISIFVYYFFGLQKTEKQLIINSIHKIIKR